MIEFCHRIKFIAVTKLPKRNGHSHQNRDHHHTDQNRSPDVVNAVPAQLNTKATERLSAGEDAALDRRESCFQGIRLRLGPLANVVEFPQSIAHSHGPSTVAIGVAYFLEEGSHTVRHP